MRHTPLWALRCETAHFWKRIYAIQLHFLFQNLQDYATEAAVHARRIYENTTVLCLGEKCEFPICDDVAVPNLSKLDELQALNPVLSPMLVCMVCYSGYWSL